MEKENLRIVFMGTPDFAVQSLYELINNKFNVVGVVTMPDKPAGRGYKLQYSAVKEYALSQGLTVLQPENLKSIEFIESLKNLNANLQIVVAFRMLPEIVWNMPKLGTFNLHGSLLPQYRGAAPINWAIINGEKYTGVTTFFLKQEIDTGEIILQKRVEILDIDNFGTMYDKLKYMGSILVIQTLEMILKDNIQTIPQSELQESGDFLQIAPKIFKDTCRINWSKTANDVFNFIRGLAPSPLAWTTYMVEGNELTIKIGAIEVIERNESKSPGTIETDNKKYLYIHCIDNIISIVEMQLPGKKILPIKDFLNGYKFQNLSSLI